jgi:hypothetical protein
MPTQVNVMPEGHIFTICFHISGATDGGDQSVRAYDDPGLQDLGPYLPIGNDGNFKAEFERPASTFADAVISALSDPQRVFPEAELVRVEPDDLITISGIAERLNRSHESIRLLVQGQRGPGGFPRQASAQGAKTRVWRWHEVVDWFEQKMDVRVPNAEHAKFLAMINDLLHLRLAAPTVIDNRRTASAMAALLPKELVA